MLTKKVCLLGAFSVGKTALAERYAHASFSDRYLSTVGVKIRRKTLSIGGRAVAVVLWDMEGKTDYVDVNISYLRGAMGFLVVADGTRRQTLETALTLRTLALDLIGPVPHALLINKADLIPDWEVTDSHLARIEQQGIRVVKTSAKSGLAVVESFNALARDLL